MHQWLYLDAAGDITGQCNMQDYQWLSWDCTVRKKVASSIWPNSTLHINPVSNRMHSFRTQWENKNKVKLCIFFHLEIGISCQPYKLSTFPTDVSDKILQSKKGESRHKWKKLNSSANCDKADGKGTLHTHSH